MSATSFSLDDITLEYSQEDYKPQSRQPKCDVWFEFEVTSAKTEQSPKGFLQVKAEAEALDSNGKKMFKKYVNIPMPISIGEHAAPTYAKGLWLMNVVPLFPEHLAYDGIKKDPITGKMVYFKGDEKLQGKEYEEAMTKQNRIIGEMARDIAKAWISDPEEPVSSFVGKRFFAKLIKSKDEKYTNIDRPYGIAPSGEDICYDAKEAMTK